MSGPILRRAILALCVDDEPYMIGADDAVRARSNRDLGHFLDPTFSKVGRAPARPPGGSAPHAAQHWRMTPLTPAHAVRTRGEAVTYWP